MARADNSYSRLVAWMKILLPLAALGLLSTLFLISNRIDPSDPAKTTEIDLTQRARDLGATNPSFAGVTERGDEIMFRADTARPDPGETTRLNAERVTAEMRLVDGTGITLRADSGAYDRRAMTVALMGAVHVTTTTGYVIDTDRLDTQLDTVSATSPGPVTATGPLGDLSAGQMQLHNATTSGAAELIFSGGVKLIYRPQIAGERER